MLFSLKRAGAPLLAHACKPTRPPPSDARTSPPSPACRALVPTALRQQPLRGYRTLAPADGWRPSGSHCLVLVLSDCSARSPLLLISICFAPTQ
jgi:hypothetical protein